MLEQLKEALLSRGLTESEVEALLHEVQLKSQVQQLASNFVRQLLAIGNWQNGFGQFNLSITISEDDQGNLVGWVWTLDANHGTIGSFSISGKVDLPTQPTTPQEPTQVEQTTRSRSNWARVIELAKRYGVEIRPYEEKAISWYAGAVLTRIAKYRIDAKGDPEFLALVEEWNQTKPKKAPEAKVS